MFDPKQSKRINAKTMNSWEEKSGIYDIPQFYKDSYQETEPPPPPSTEPTPESSANTSLLL